jgi:hypothetical protein
LTLLGILEIDFGASSKLVSDQLPSSRLSGSNPIFSRHEEKLLNPET